MQKNWSYFLVEKKKASHRFNLYQIPVHSQLNSTRNKTTLYFMLLRSISYSECAINIYPQLILAFLLCNQHIMYSHLFPAASSQATVQENKMIHSMVDGELNISWSSPPDMPCHFISPFFFLTHRLLHTSESTTLPRHRIQIVITTHFFFILDYNLLCMLRWLDS